MTHLHLTNILLLCLAVSQFSCGGTKPQTEASAVTVTFMAPGETPKTKPTPSGKVKAKRKPKATVDVAGLLAARSATDKPAPERFVVQFDTTRGTFQAEIIRAWAPHGVDRFYALVKKGFYRNIAFFRVISGFMCQFGIHGTPAVALAWRSASIPDDPVRPGVASNQRGYITFAKAGPNTRSSQLFISFRNNANLDKMGFPPIGRVIGGGMMVVDQMYAGYGEGPPRGRGPNQALIHSDGNAYLKRSFPDMDYINAITLAL